MLREASKRMLEVYHLKSLINLNFIKHVCINIGDGNETTIIITSFIKSDGDAIEINFEIDQDNDTGAINNETLVLREGDLIYSWMYTSGFPEEEMERTMDYFGIEIQDNCFTLTTNYENIDVDLYRFFTFLVEIDRMNYEYSKKVGTTE